MLLAFGKEFLELKLLVLDPVQLFLLINRRGGGISYGGGVALLALKGG